MNDRAADDLDARARAILRGNDRGGYTVPTAGLYPYQWNWDSAFAAWGFAGFGADRAWTELETLLSGQWDDGMVPHILFHRPDPGYFPGPDVWGGRGPIASSGITQPPVAASFARRILDGAPDTEDRMRALWPKLDAWHRWFHDWRLDEHGAVCVTHPWEAGRDNAPDWDGPLGRVDPTGVGDYTRRDTNHVDPAMRPTKYDYDRYVKLVQVGRDVGWDHAWIAANNPFRVADPTMTFLLLRAERDLAAMGDALDQDTGGVPDRIARLEAGAQSLWNDGIGAYDGHDVLTGERTGSLSNAAFLCWYAGVDDDRMLAPLDRILNATRYALPSHDPAAPTYEPLRYWRGPVWPIMNCLAGLGLAERGHAERADRIRRDTRALIAERGFAEYYHPDTGQPAGGGTFTWTAAVWLRWAGTQAGEGRMTGSIELRAVEKWFGETQVIKGVDLTLDPGEFVVFVGPSGCGKSTLLRMIAGLEETSRGSIIIDGRDVTAEPPARRGLAMVFQSYALYPHMSVGENMGFSLKTAGAPKTEIEAKVGEAARVLRLTDYLDRRPKDLSGGQRQRVAIGRSIVRDPTAFLFDEPLSNLDAALRVEMRYEIAKLHQTLEASMVYVTHDQVEAMTLADRIVVLQAGRIEQVGRPRELYERPANLFVAQFIGSPKMNVMPAAALPGAPAGAAHVGVRPEAIGLGGDDLRGTVDVAEYLGADTYLIVDCGAAGKLTVRTGGATEVRPGEAVGLSLPVEARHVFDGEGRRVEGT